MFGSLRVPGYPNQKRIIERVTLRRWVITTVLVFCSVPEKVGEYEDTWVDFVKSLASLHSKLIKVTKVLSYPLPSPPLLSSLLSIVYRRIVVALPSLLYPIPFPFLIRPQAAHYRYYQFLMPNDS